MYFLQTLPWRHNDHDGVSNHQPHGCLLNRLFRRISKKTSKLRVTGLCVGNSPGPMNSPHKGPVTRKMFPFDDVIMNCVCCMKERRSLWAKTHCGRVTPCGVVDLDELWFRRSLGVWRQHVITWTSVNLSSIWFCAIHIKAVWYAILKISVTENCENITRLKFQPYFRAQCVNAIYIAIGIELLFIGHNQIKSTLVKLVLQWFVEWRTNSGRTVEPLI